MLLTRSRENCTTCGTRIVSFCLLLVGWLLRTRVGHPSKARGERATHSMARRGGGTGRRSSRTHKASEHRGPRATSPRDKSKITSGDFLNARTHCPFQPHLGSPHSKSTRGTERERGLAPDPDRRSARPGRAGCLREREKQKNKTAPPGRPPHSRSTRGTEAVKGLPPDPSRRSARPPGRAGRLREKKRKGRLR